MATILPFKPIRPNPLYANQLVFTKPQAESVSGDYTKAAGLKPLKTLLETGARLRPETPEGQLLAYQDIRDTLQHLEEKEALYREKTPGIYIYEVIHKNYRQTAVWALTSLQDYEQGRIKIHELTFPDSVRRMRDYRENTGLEGSPILLTYSPNVAINRIIAETKVGSPQIALGNQNGLHKLWKIEDTEIQQALIRAFGSVHTVYLADGHHRLESSAQLAEKQAVEGKASPNCIGSLYMATDQLKIEPYNRVIIPETRVDMTIFFAKLGQVFHIRESSGNHPVQPEALRRMGLYLAGEWFHLLVKDESAGLDAAILQENVLLPIFGIEDPKTDSRLKCAGGEKALEEILGIIRAHPTAIVFTLSPMTAEQLISVAEAGQILPPKSTWIVPKVPYGLLIQQHENN